MSKISIVIFSLLVYSSSISADVINHCDDPIVNEEWERLIHKNGHHFEWRSIYSLRIDLCDSIKKGVLSIKEASKKFEDHRIKMIEQLRKRLEKKYGKNTNRA